MVSCGVDRQKYIAVLYSVMAGLNQQMPTGLAYDSQGSGSHSDPKILEKAGERGLGLLE